MSDSGRTMREQCGNCGQCHDSMDFRECVSNLRAERDRLARYVADLEEINAGLRDRLTAWTMADSFRVGK